jgi:hypothetical protein
VCTSRRPRRCMPLEGSAATDPRRPGRGSRSRTRCNAASARRGH